MTDKLKTIAKRYVNIFGRIKQIGVFLAIGFLFSNDIQATPTCPAQNFNAFIKAFANDIGIQKAFTHTPLKNTYRDDRIDGAPFKTEFINAVDAQYPIMLAEYHNGWTLPTSIERTGRYVYKVRVTADNSTITLKFQKNNACWQLNSIYNPAL